MPYVPQDAQTPISKDFACKEKDLEVARRLIEERWKQYPLLLYYPLLKALTPETPDDHPVGEVGTTLVDPLWGEPVGPNMAGAPWTQPHGSSSPVVKAANPMQYGPPVRINGRVQRTVHEKQLKLWGFDKLRKLVVTFPLSVLDDLGVTIQVGDRVGWGPEPFRIIEASREGYWHNTNIRLYVVCNCDSWRAGS